LCWMTLSPGAVLVNIPAVWIGGAWVSYSSDRRTELLGG
jgi:hypothetical protein